MPKGKNLLKPQPEIACICPICKGDLGMVSAEGFRFSRIMDHIAQEHPDYCFCGEPLMGHPKCAACAIYMGEHHLEHPVERKASDGRKIVLCGSCARVHDKNPRYIEDYIAKYGAK